MSNPARIEQGPGAAAFDVVLRGYDRRQVDEHLGVLTARIAALEDQLHRDLQPDQEVRLDKPRGGEHAGSGRIDHLAGLGVQVESVLRVAAQEADGLRRAAAEDARNLRQHGERELRARFTGVVERLTPLVKRLDEEARAAESALPELRSTADGLASAARQHAKTLVEVATADAIRIRKNAENRAEVAIRQRADAHEELSLVTELLASLGRQISAPTPRPETRSGQSPTEGASAEPAAKPSPAPTASPMPRSTAPATAPVTAPVSGPVSGPTTVAPRVNGTTPARPPR